MKTIDPHSLIQRKIREINITDMILELYQIWKNLMDKTDSNISDFDSFVAGYFLGTNSNLKQKYINLKFEEKFDNRIR